MSLITARFPGFEICLKQTIQTCGKNNSRNNIPLFRILTCLEISINNNYEFPDGEFLINV